MQQLMVVDRQSDWPLDLPGVAVVAARDYLADPSFSSQRRLRVFNLCRSHHYQGTGYYVSLLAQARGHRPVPSVASIQDARARGTPRLFGTELNDLIQRSLKDLRTDSFELTVCFGRNPAARHQALARRLFALLEAPLLRADFQRQDNQWRLTGLRLLGLRDLSDSLQGFVSEAAGAFLADGPPRSRRKRSTRYDLAMLVDGNESDPPSDEGALRRFEQAGDALGVAVTRIGKDDIARLPEFDALFIRVTTAVNHYTWRFAQRAQAEGLEVIDDPESILRCTNKVFLAELLVRHKIPAPRTRILHRRNRDDVLADLGLPLVLKSPDGSFSSGVFRAKSKEDFRIRSQQLLADSDLVVAQEYLPTAYDWRIGVLDGQPLYACRYFMAREHWQIIRRDSGKTETGNWDTVPLEEVPAGILRNALRAARLMGRGLYGVDMKEVGRRNVVIEVNDNPSLESGVEDGFLGKELYQRIISTFVERLDARRNPPRAHRKAQP